MQKKYEKMIFCDVCGKIISRKAKLFVHNA